MPASPSLGPARSPHVSATPTSAPSVEDGKMQKSKAIRLPLIHFLAVRPVSEKYLAQTLCCEQSECREVLDRVGKKFRLDESKWDLTDKAYRELDAYGFQYPTQDDRQLAIDRAVTAYDRLRLSHSDPLWQKLLPLHERGRGKVISKLNLKEGPKVQKAMTPRINVQATDDAATGKLTPSNDSDTRRLAPSDAESRVRSKSKDSVQKSKGGDVEARTKKLLSKSPMEPTKAQKSKEKPQSKTADAKKVAKKGPTPKVVAKSSEFVHDSDEDEDEDMTDVSTLQSKPNASKPSAAIGKASPTASASKHSPPKRSQHTKPTTAGDVKSQQKPSTPHHQIAEKRPPTSSSSSSGSKHRFSDSGHTPFAASKPLSRQRTTSSPHKPSPLGSSPPANASDLDNDGRLLSSASSTPLIAQSRDTKKETSHRQPSVAVNDNKPIQDTSERSLKRKADDIDSDIHNHNAPIINGVALTNGLANGVKRHKASPLSPPTSDSSSGNVSDMKRQRALEEAQRFKKFWAKYHELYQEVSTLPKDVPNAKFDELLKMHERLSRMKADIAKASTP